MALATSITDIISAVLIANPQQFSKTILYIPSVMYYACQNMVPFLYCFYIIAVVKDESLFKKPAKAMSVCAPVIISQICIFTTFFTGSVFYFDDNLAYHHGWAFWLLHIIAAYYMIYGIVYVKMNKKHITKDKRWALYSFVFVAMIPVGFQVLFPQQLIANLAISICLLLIMFTIQNPEEVLEATTGLFNKNTFNLMIEMELESKTEFIIQYIEIKDVKYLFTVFGFDNIYSLLRKFGAYLEQVCSRKEELYCIDDGQFAILRKRLNYDQIYEHSKTIYQECRKSWNHNDINIDLDICVAVVKCPENADAVTDIYHCFEEIRNSDTDDVVSVSDDGVEKRKRVSLVQTAIHNALENNSLQIYYQPIYSAKEKRLRSAEALVRLKDPELGFIPPDEFITISEKNGMIIKIGLFVFESVCKMINEHVDELECLDYIEVNLSVVQCMQNNLWEQLLDIMKKYNIPASKINLEITESAAANSFGTLVHNMKMLHNEGITFSLDDYGTGYSSVNYITELPFKMAKLDKSMVWSADENEKSQIALESTVKMMKSLELEIVAEGIETEDHKVKIIGMGCDFLQGYYFSKPVPKDEFLSILKSKE